MLSIFYRNVVRHGHVIFLTRIMYSLIRLSTRSFIKNGQFKCYVDKKCGHLLPRGLCQRMLVDTF